MPITEKQTVCVNSGFAHPADTTKQVQFDMSGITADSPAVVTVPDASGTMAMTNSTSCPKAWCVFNGITTGTNAPIAGLNVTSVTRGSAGSYTINFTADLPSTNYSSFVTVDANGDALLGLSYTGTVSTLQVRTYSLAGALTDNGQISVIVFGT